MRILHTADWHLGRLFFGMQLVPDQAHVLDQLVALVADARPDVVVIAGDIYDRAVPPPEAVDLLDDVLCRLVIGQATPVILIAGNHDSPGRLEFGSRLLEARRLHVRGALRSPIEPVNFQDTDGPVHFYPVPYAEPSTLRHALKEETVVDHASGMRAVTSAIRAADPSAARRVLIGHAYVAGGEPCGESERPLSVGGAGTVDRACFEGFQYTALGHLHRPQSIGAAIHYSGAILKYAFDESDQERGVILANLAGDGSCAIERIALTPRRQLRRIRGRMADLLAGEAAAFGAACDDYIEATLLDDGPIVDAMIRLRAAWPNVLQVRREAIASLAQRSGDRPDVRGISEIDLFTSFFQHVTGSAPSDEQRQAMIEITDEMDRHRREADSAARPETAAQPIGAATNRSAGRAARRSAAKAAGASPIPAAAAPSATAVDDPTPTSGPVPTDSPAEVE